MCPNSLDGNSVEPTDVQVASGPGIVRTATFGAATPQRKTKSSSASSSRIETIPMLPGNAITVVEHRPHGANKDHQAVSLLEQGHGSNGLDTGKGQQLNSIAHRKKLDPGGAPKIILTNEGIIDVISAIQTLPGRSSQHHEVVNIKGDRDGSLGQ
ncbi:hypothetical protein V6N11_069800 [Hibiscus sabdariffa]|uniref:Uncharacterized protein n=1 Tax=Hibiscus sabdariffa TaxID=183260 RepID=A0ABR2Q3U1_9ROSI